MREDVERFRRAILAQIEHDPDNLVALAMLQNDYNRACDQIGNPRRSDTPPFQ